MIGQLYDYFGVVGLASIAAWAIALALLLIFSRLRHRNFAYLAAFIFAVLGLVLANINSQSVSAIQIDRTEELRAGRQRQERARQIETATAGHRFVEDAPPAGDDSDAAAEPAYRRGGKQQREGGKSEPAIVSTDAATADNAPKPRMMQEADVVRANSLDRSNLLAARATVLLTLLLVLWDYLVRFNRTSESYLPLPIGGRWLDALSRKRYSIFMASPTDRSCKRLLERFVRRGETFIYFGPTDLWPSGSLPRLSVGGKTVRSLPRMIYDEPGATSEFAFEAAWFGRYGVVVTNPAVAARLLQDLRPYLRIRHLTRAAAMHTVNVVWNLPTPPQNEALRELLLLTRETNFRMVVCGANQSSPKIAARFEEVLA